MEDEFVVYSAEEKFLADYLVYNTKKRRWRDVISIATDLLELEINQRKRSEDLSSDAGMLDLKTGKVTKEVLV